MGYEIEPYSLKDDLTINLEKLEQQIDEFKPSVVLFHRYFGFDTCKGIEKIIHRDGIITIEDETQYIFSEPRQTWSDYQIGSIRKWGAFPDGAYLASKKKIISQPVEEDDKLIRLELQAMKKKQAYLDKKSNETDYRQMFADTREYVDAQKQTFSMSAVSNYNLEKLNVKQFADAHHKNAKILIDGLQGFSWFDCVFKSIPDGITPFMIPLMVHEGRKELQCYLASEKIFATVIWGCPDATKEKLEDTDKRIYDEILCIPCDYRYDDQDMTRIIEAVQKYEKKSF